LGAHSVKVSVSDGKASVGQSYTLTISGAPPTNTPPRITSDPVTTGTVGAPYSYQVEATDDDGDPLTYSLTEAPSGMSISSSGLITWASPVLGAHSVKVSVSDGKASVGQSYTLTISGAPPTNTPPRITSDPVTAGVVGAPYSYQVEAVDDDGDPLTYSLTEAPSGMSINSSGLITWASPVLGTHSVKVSVSDGKATAEQSYTLTINATPTPEITLASPANGGSYQQGDAIPLSANTHLPPAEVKTVEFFAGTARIAVGTLSGNQYTAAWSSAPAGSHTIFARLTDNADKTYDSASVNITVSAACAPEINLTSPANGATVTAPGELILTAQATLDASCGAITKVEFYSSAQLLYTTTATPYTYTWQNIPAGSYTLTAKAYSAGADNTSAAVQVTVESEEPTPELLILAPANGATINDTVTTISGTFTYSQGATIIANGREAQIKEDGSFAIYDMPLQTGSNAFTVVLNTREHDPVSKDITVTGAGTPPITIALSPARGLAPLEAALSFQLQKGDDPSNYCYEFLYSKDGGATTDLLDLEDSNKRIFTEDQVSFSFIFPEAGEYAITIDVTYGDVAGQPECSVPLLTTKRTIVVSTPAQLGKTVVDTYLGMVDQLSQNRPDKALKYFIGDMREIYSDIFTKLGEDLPQIASQITNMVNGVVSEDVAELMVVTDTPEGKQLTPVYLMRGIDGVWRISGM